MTLRAVIYVRLSSLRVDDPSVSPQEQERACRAYCEAHGWDVVDVVEDLDVSGSDKGLRLDRPGIVEIRDRLAEVDIVVARSLDRIARNVLDFVTLAEELTRSGVALVSVKEGLDLSTAAGRFVATILAAFAEMEADTIAARVRDGRDGLAREGRYGGGNIGYGYRSAPHPSGKGRTLVPDPNEAAIARRAADFILSGGSLYGACQMLNREGLKPRRAEVWTTTALHRALTGDHVIGRLTHRGEPVRGADGLPAVVFDPILPREDWEALRRALGVGYGPKGASKRRKKSARLLSGLAHCALCGKPLYASYSTRRVAGTGGREMERVYTYRCANDACKRLSIRQAHLEGLVVDEFRARYWPLPYTEHIAVTRDVAGLADVEEAIRDTAAAMTRPGADFVALGERMATLHSRRDALRSTVPGVTFEEVATGKTWAEEFDARDDAGRRRLLFTVIDRIEVGPGVRGRKGLDPDRVVIYWRGGDVTRGQRRVGGR